jgi:thiamine pyrophosphate-dependent acetolactate synthase large subunit-like protein
VIPDYTFAVPGSDVDDYLRAQSQVWITSDEFAAGCAAIAFHMVTGDVAQLVAPHGPGTNMALPALAMAAQERIPVQLYTGAAWTAPELPGPAMLACGQEGEALHLVRFTDRGADPGGREVVMEGSAIPGARLFGDRWLGYWGFMCDEQVRTAVAARPLVSAGGQVRAPALSTFVASAAPAWVDTVVRELDQVLPEEASVIADAGCSRESVIRLIARRGLRPVVQTRGLTTMGWSLGAALGVHAGRPGVPLGVVIGDGSLMARLGDLAVLAKYAVPAVILVIVNGLLGESRRGWTDQSELAMLPEVDWPAVVTALGASVADDVASATADCHHGPQLVLVEGPR